MSGQTILITRPKGEEKSLAEALHASGYRVIHEPLMEIFLRHTERQALQAALMEEPDAVIVTSRHAVQALALLSDLRDPFLLCVGAATAQAAQSLGFSRTAACGGNVDSLVHYVTAGYDEDSRFLYLSGAQVRADLDDILSAYRMRVQRLVLYDAIASTQLSDTLVEQLRRGQVDAATFLSARTAQIFAQLLAKSGVQQAAEGMTAFCLSDAVTAPLGELAWKSVQVAREATLASLVECIDNAFLT